MSSAKFASITASLLARKGEAQPWNPVGMAEPERLAPTWRTRLPEAAMAPPPPPPGKDKSCSVRMSMHDFERLGILAVKSDTTRQQLLKEALAQFLAAKAKDFGCACLGACNSNCGSEV
jgi:hypothetical protein